MKFRIIFAIVPVCWLAHNAAAQTSPLYVGRKATGEFTLARTVNALKRAQLDAQATALKVSTLRASVVANTRELPKFGNLQPPRVAVRAAAPLMSTADVAPTTVLNVLNGPAATGFNGLTHSDQRLANGGNQFSI